MQVDVLGDQEAEKREGEASHGVSYVVLTQVDDAEGDGKKSGRTTEAVRIFFG